MMPSRNNRQRSGTREQSMRDWLGDAVRVVMAAALVAVAVVAWLQWKALSTIEKLIDASQRPWIAASVEPVGLTFDDKGGGITLRIALRNSGAVPATDVLTTPVLLLDAKQPYKQACSHYGVGGGLGPSLSSNEALPKTSTAWVARGDFGQVFPSLLAVCIKYRFADNRRHGEAGYLFSIVQRAPGQPDRPVTEAKNGTLNPPELALLPVASYHD